MLDDTKRLIVDFEQKMMSYAIEREDAYIKRQILINRKWHSFWYFLRWALTGKD